MKRNLKRLGIALGVLLGAAVLAVGGYVLYMVLQYDRIPDHQPLTVENPQTAQLCRGQAYTAATYNIGFGAYDPDFSFFMDTGTMKDGTPVQGEHGRAQSEQIVLKDTQGAIDTLQGLGPDFCLLQEVDTDATRSFHIDQSQMVRQAFPQYGAVFASISTPPILPIRSTRCTAACRRGCSLCPAMRWRRPSGAAIRWTRASRRSFLIWTAAFPYSAFRWRAAASWC